MSAGAPLSYKSRAEADADRTAQISLVNTLNVHHGALRRDECAAWRINGEHGHIYSWDDESFLLYVFCGSVRAWSAVKKRLAFCQATQDGDDEGCLRLFGLPTAVQAAAI